MNAAIVVCLLMAGVGILGVAQGVRDRRWGEAGLCALSVLALVGLAFGAILLTEYAATLEPEVPR